MYVFGFFLVNEVDLWNKLSSEKLPNLTSSSDSSENLTNIPVSIKDSLNAYRILMIKGPFRKNTEKDDMGCHLIFDQLKKL